MKASPPKPPETDEPKLDTPLSRIMNIVTPAPTERSNPWSIEAQGQRDVSIVSTILQRYRQHRDKLELRGGARSVSASSLTRCSIARTSALCSTTRHPSAIAAATAIATRRARDSTRH